MYYRKTKRASFDEMRVFVKAVRKYEFLGKQRFKFGGQLPNAIEKGVH